MIGVAVFNRSLPLDWPCRAVDWLRANWLRLVCNCWWVGWRGTAICLVLWLVWESHRMDALDPEGVARLFFLQEGGQ